MKNIIILLLCLLTACASLGPVKSVTQSPEKISHWQASGAMSIRQANRSTAFSFEWQQESQQRYTLRLFAPLGLGSLRIVSSEDHVSLWQSGSQRIMAKTPELLMQQELGYTVPLTSLYYWARGLPDPHFPVVKSGDAQPHLIQLQQQAWKIKFLDFKIISGFDLPTQIILENKTMHVKIVITRWRLS